MTVYASGIQLSKNMIVENIWYCVEYGAIRGLTGILNCLPITLATWVSRRIGDVMFYLMPGRRAIALHNLNLAFGDEIPHREKMTIILQNFRHMVVSLMELFRMPRFAKHAGRHIRFEGFEHLAGAFQRGKGVVLVISHLGAWEYLAFMAQLKQIAATIVAKTVRNPFLNRWIESLRLRATLKQTDRTKAARTIFSEIKKNHLIAIIIDQWAGNQEHWVSFFGKSASTTTLPARIAKKTDCSLIPAFCLRLKPGEYLIQVQPDVVHAEDEHVPKVSVDGITTTLNGILERAVRTSPEQWVWTHKRWKDKKEYTQTE